MTLPIRVKILLISVAILSATLGATAWVSGVVFTNEYSSALQSRAFVIGHSLALQLNRLMRLHIPLSDLVGFDEQCREIVERHPGITFARVIDSGGRILFHSNSSERDLLIQDPELVRDIRRGRESIGIYETEGAPVYGTIIPVVDGEGAVIAAINIGFPVNLISQKTRRMVEYSVATAAVFFGIGSILLMVLMNLWVSRPLRRLLAVIKDIMQTGVDSTKTVQVASQDEIGQLGEAFNGMILELKGSHRKIHEYAGGLEKRVQERTEELARANEKLRMDLEERLRLEKHLQQAQKMESIGKLAGGIAHDFNNLLSVITGNADLALMNSEEGMSLRGFLEEIKAAGLQAGGLTRQILAFSRRQIIQPRVVNLNEILSNARKMLSRLIGENIELVIRHDPKLAKVEVDPGQMEQVILNLAVNSRDAMPDGGKLTIETANVELDEAYCREHFEAVPGCYVMVAVADTGTGMDEGVLARIFEPFFTTKEVGKGTGMGLATVYGIVKQNRGHIYVSSGKGRGTTFKVYLPCLEGAQGELPQEDRSSPEHLTGSETILVVEDDQMIRKLICRVLSENGYRVLQAQSGNEAIEIEGLHQGPIHLVLTDVIMPGMNIREMVQWIESRREEARILFMSGYTDDIIAPYGVLDPGIEFLSKPFTSLGIMRRIRQVLDATRPTLKSNLSL